jgi:prepilin-type processing-associated H-X9-DG protein
MDFSSSSDNTNTLFLTDIRFSQLAPYLRDPKVYRCPSDRSEVSIGGHSHPRARSVSMNCWMNYIGTLPIGQDLFRVFRKLDDIVDPSPAKAWVLMDEREDSINDGLFQTNLKMRGVQARIVDFPASYHGRSAGIVFADGHAEVKRWRDPRTTPPLRARQNLELDVASPDNPDVAWLQDHSSSAREVPE